jgi:hypothetical protein
MTDRDAEKRHRRRRSVLVAIAVLAIAILLLLLCYCQPKTVVEAPHPLDRVPALTLGDAIVTGFSGIVEPDPDLPLPAGKSAPDQTFIDVNGPSVRIFDPRKPGFVWNGNYWALPHKYDIPARSVGQVFGVALDNLAYPDIYLTATSVYGLNIVTPDSDNDTRPERVKTGRLNAGWAPGQFGPGGGPGSIWKVDGRSGRITRFADVELNGKGTGPASLGNIAYDAGHRQLFVSDLSTGMIHRFGLNGKDLGHFDHGVDGRAAAHLQPRRYDPSSRADIARKEFDSENPATWGFAPPERMVWGLAVHKGRLYYAVAAGGEADNRDEHGKSVPDAGQIWSVGLDRRGNFARDPRLEIALPGETNAAPISDIVFTKDGAMIAAQRATIGTTYKYNALPAAKVAHVNRFWREKPNDPETTGDWYQAPEEYAVGYAGDNRNSAGGVALGYGYHADGTIDLTGCEDAIFLTGDNLRGFHKRQDEFIPGGSLDAYGLQISPKGPVRGFNVPPSISYFVNYADRMSSAKRDGTVGDVTVYRLDCAVGACGLTPAGGVATERRRVPPVLPPPGLPPPGVSSPDPGCVGADCIPCLSGECPPPPDCLDSDCCEGEDCTPDEPELCMKVEGEAVCDPQAGGWVFKVVTQDLAGIGLDTLTAHSTTTGVGVGNGPDISVVPPPGIIALSGTTPGQTVTVDICGFDSAARATGKPYDCCRATLSLNVPEEICTPAEGPQ